MTKVRYIPKGYAQFAVGGSAISLGTAAMTYPSGTAPPAGAEIAMILPETQAIRFADMGGTPTASVGWPVAASGVFKYDGNISSLRLIAQSGTATVNVLFFGGDGGFTD